ncbi:MAG TPA: hypothetical protein DEB10_07445, partial [Ruminococcaceae bacterium]|nr:hypothetical protein [Oscillospiraceae bacterium]
TIFDEHRISISEWIEYCMNLFRHVSISVDSWNNRNAFSTSRYWLQKVFLTLQGSQDGIVLSGDVWLDETYYSVISRDAVRHEDGKKLRGLSRNQLCIGVATDKRHTLFLVEGNGKPSQKKTFETFHSHIAPGSTLIHDKEQAHAKLIKVLALQSTVYASEELKGLPDRENPLEPVNRQHALMKHFLNAHAGFLRENLQGYLDLFSYVTNPPYDLAEKVDSLINLVFHNPKSLRYRDFYQAKSSDSEPWMQHYAIDDLNYFYPINKAVDHYKQVAERLLKTDSVSAYDKIAIKYHLSQYKYLNDDIEAMSYNTYELKKVLDYAQTAEHNDQFIFKEGVKKLYYLSHIDNAVQIFTISIPKGYRKDCKYPLFLIFSTFRNSFDAGLYSNYLDRPIIAADITGRGFTLGSYIGEAVIWDLIDHIKSVFSIDTDKIYATGVSNGAAAVWAQSEMYPDRFAGIFPVSGPVNSSLICNLKDLPVINVSSKTEELYAWAYKSVHEKLRSFPKYTGVLSEKMCHDDLTWIKCKTDFIELMLKEARELYPKEIEYKTFSNRHRKAYWIEIHSISFGRKVAKIKAEMTQEGFDVRCSNVSGFTISLSPTANQKYISIKINNGKKFAVHNYINNEI